MPIFNQGNVSQVLAGGGPEGPFLGIITNYSIKFTRQCLVSFAFSFTSNNNNFNAYLTLNNDATIFFESIRVEGNATGSINFIHQFSANDELFFNTDQAGNFYGVSLAIREIVYNRKVINNTVNTGTLLSLLGDTDILLPQNNQVLQFNSTSGKWENKNITGYTHKSLQRLNISNTNQLGVSNTTQNGLANSCPWMQEIAGQTILSFDPTVFQKNSNYQLQILQNGKYRIDIHLSNNTGNNSF